MRPPHQHPPPQQWQHPLPWLENAKHMPNERQRRLEYQSYRIAISVVNTRRAIRLRRPPRLTTFIHTIHHSK
jgi:hypothetical protein